MNLVIHELLCYLAIPLGQGAGLSVSGRVDSGHVQVGETVFVLPAQETVSVKCR